MFYLRQLSRPLAAFAVIVLLHGVGSLLIPDYTSEFSIRSMLVLAVLLGVASIGQTLVILLGGIDLSIPFLIGFGNVVTAQLYGDGWPFWGVGLIVVVLSLAIGSLNGALSSYLRIHPLILTLGVGTVVQGVIQLWTAGFPSGSAPNFVNNFVSIGESVGFIPVPAVVPGFVVLVLLIGLMLHRMAYGKRLYAVGSNPDAAPFSLINPHHIRIIAYALSAFFAALAGVLLLGFTGSAYGDVGQPYLFQTIAAVVVGGTTLIGGRGGILGTVSGAMVLTELNTLLIGLGLTPALVQAATGILIVVLVSVYGRERHIRATI